MKEWEVSKVNALYKEIDDLKSKNAALEAVGSLSALNEKLDSIEKKVDEICKCCDCTPPVKKKTK